MFEALVGLGSRGQTNFPNSGPGSKNLLYGNEQLGYFGTLTPAELVTLGKLRSLFNFFNGNDEGAPYTWVKMFYKGKVLYFPTNTLAYNLSWNQLYNAGLVYGVDSNGNYPTATPTNQFKILNVGTDVLKVRLFAADSNPDPTSSGSQQLLTGAGANISGSEFVQLIYALVQGAPAAYSGPKWGIFSASSFAWGGRKVPTQRTYVAGPSYAQHVDNTYTYSSPKTELNYWLPVLELIPGNELPLLPYIDLAAQLDPLQPASIADVIQSVGLAKYRGTTTTVVIHEPAVVTDVTYPSQVLKIKRTEVQLETGLLNQLVVTDIVYT
jgi:hypothetical protein